MSFTPSSASAKRVHFNREVSKWSLGSPAPTIQRISTVENQENICDSNIVNTNKKLNIHQQQSSSQFSNENNLITVGIRVRPLNAKEKSSGNSNILKINDTTNEITLTDRLSKLHKFSCDFVITNQQVNVKQQEADVCVEDSQQLYVYEKIGKPLLNKAYDGYNVSIFAYGQTGSGKTYSMIGTNDQPGLIPRFFEDLFERKSQRDQIGYSTHVEISYYEIYNEKIYDLLRSADAKEKPSSTSNQHALNGRNLQIRENPQTGPYIVDLLSLSANSAADAKLWLDIGNKRRATACTNMNSKSSRSHSVFQINLTQMLDHGNKHAANKQTKSSNTQLLQLVTSRINLIDLAGSERINNAFNTNNTGSTSSMVGNATSSSVQMTSSRLKESTCINKSLLTLGKIICLLSERQTASSSSLNSNSNTVRANAAMINSSSNSSGSYLPYRESVLTWLLKESLGGNAKTAMLATVNASNNYLEETLCTLRYAAKTACIKNVAHLNRNFKQKYINDLGEETEMSLILPPMSSNVPFDIKSSKMRDAQLEVTIRIMEEEWKEKLEEAERLKQKEINDLEKSLIVLYENETRAQNCCLINLNEDPSLSEKLIYLLKSSDAKLNSSIESIETLVGSDKNLVNIHLTGPLIAQVHSKIWKKHDDNNYYIQHTDKNYVTYLNGEVVEQGKEMKLSHGDRIIFGGSHFFRFNNPANNKQHQQQTSINTTNSAMDNNQFKDYQFAKNEIERKQNELIQEKLNEALNKCKKDGDLKMQELKEAYEKNLESIKSDLEKEKNARKLELEQLKTASHKKIKQIVDKKILIETNLKAAEIEALETKQELDKHEKNFSSEIGEEKLSSKLVASSASRTDLTPLNANLTNRLFLNKIHSSAFKSFDQQEIIQTHANSNGLFGITLKVTEINKICNILGFDYEFKRNEVVIDSDNLNDSSMSSASFISSSKSYIQTICVIDKRLNLVTLWNMDTFEYKLNSLREIYARYIDEGSLSSSLGSSSTESIFITDSADEWQTLDTFIKREETFSPRIIENAIGRNNGKKACKRRLSILTNSMNSLNTSGISELGTKAIENLEENSALKKGSTAEIIDDNSDIKRKFVQDTCVSQFLTPQHAQFRTPTISKSVNKLFATKQMTESNLNQNQGLPNQLIICNSFVYATCRDALNEDLNIDEEDDDFDDDELDFDEIDDDQSKKKIDTIEKKSNTLPTIDDNFLKCYARLIYNLKKLMEFQFTSENKAEELGDASQLSSVTLCNDLLNSNNDQPLFCMKIIVIFSQLTQFKPDYWSLVNGDNQTIIKKIYTKINRLFKMLKDSINCLFQSIENNLDSMAKSKYELINSQIAKLISLHGEYTFLTCSNIFLNRGNYSLNMIDVKYLCEYSNGIDKQFKSYLDYKFKDFPKNSIFDFIECVRKFWNLCHESALFKKTESSSSEIVIDCCNFMLQTHFRLSTILKLINHQDKLLEEKVKNKLNQQIVDLMYSILTDSLTLNGTGILDCYSDNKKSEWGELLVNKFKKFRFFLLNQQNVGESTTCSTNNISEKNISNSESILDTCRLSIDVLNDD